MRDIPWDVLLSFPLPNYVDPPTRGTSLIVINAVFIGLVVTAVLLRLYTRLRIKRWFGSDDAFMIPAAISTVALGVTVILANTRYYWDRHVWDIPLTALPNAGKIAMAAKILFTFASTFTRISLLCFYYRLVRDSGLRWFNWCLHSGMTFVVLVGIAFVFLSIIQCIPVSAYWEFPPSPDSYCLDEGRVTLAAGIVNCFADLLVTCLPIPLILNLQIPMRDRIAVICLLSLGFVVTIAGVVRTYFIWKSLMDSYDETWLSYPLWIAAAVEIDLAIICACVPPIRPLLREVLDTSNLTDRITSVFSTMSSRRASPKNSNASSSSNAKSPSGTLINSTLNRDSIKPPPTDVEDNAPSTRRSSRTTKLRIVKRESFQLSELEISSPTLSPGVNPSPYAIDLEAQLTPLNTTISSITTIASTTAATNTNSNTPTAVIRKPPLARALSCPTSSKSRSNSNNSNSDRSSDESQRWILPIPNPPSPPSLKDDDSATVHDPATPVSWHSPIHPTFPSPARLESASGPSTSQRQRHTFPARPHLKSYGYASGKGGSSASVATPAPGSESVVGRTTAATAGSGVICRSSKRVSNGSGSVPASATERGGGNNSTSAAENTPGSETGSGIGTTGRTGLEQNHLTPWVPVIRTATTVTTISAGPATLCPTRRPSKMNGANRKSRNESEVSGGK